VARVVWALLCAFSSSDGLTDPSVFNALSRYPVRLRHERAGLATPFDLVE
jgi:hypothetical protein